jgi:hypothetical protein
MAQLVFVDLETTGLEVERHGIIEIACIFETDGKREAEGLQSLVNPGDVEYSEAAAAVHKIPRETIATAPPLLDVLRQFDRRGADGAIVSGWNTNPNRIHVIVCGRYGFGVAGICRRGPHTPRQVTPAVSPANKSHHISSQKNPLERKC